jgi:hypothetical protein
LPRLLERAARRAVGFDHGLYALVEDDHNEPSPARARRFLPVNDRGSLNAGGFRR